MSSKVERLTRYVVVNTNYGDNSVLEVQTILQNGMRSKATEMATPSTSSTLALSDADHLRYPKAQADDNAIAAWTTYVSGRAIRHDQE